MSFFFFIYLFAAFLHSALCDTIHLRTTDIKGASETSKLSWKVLSKLGSFHDCLNSVHHLILEAYVLTQKNLSVNDYKTNCNWYIFYFQSIFSQLLKMKSSFDFVSGFCGMSLPDYPFFTLCLIPRSRPGPHF